MVIASCRGRRSVVVFGVRAMRMRHPWSDTEFLTRRLDPKEELPGRAARTEELIVQYVLS